MKRETRKPLTLAMTPEGDRVRMLRTAPPAPDFTPPPAAPIPLAAAPKPPREPRPPKTPTAKPPRAESTPGAASGSGPWLARNAYPLAAAAALLWGGTLFAFVAGYEGKGGAFEFRPFRWAVAAGLALLPMGFMALFAYAVRQAARLAGEAQAAHEMAAELSVPAALAAGRTGSAMEEMRAEIARATEAADAAGQRLSDLRRALAEHSMGVAEAAVVAENGARTLGDRLQTERGELTALNAAIGEQTTAITAGLAQQVRQMAEASEEARTRLAEAELGLATRTAELVDAAAGAGRAADAVGDELSTQNSRLEALAADLREEREDLARTADALMVEEEALGARLEGRRARLLDVAETSRADAAQVVAAAAEGGEGLRLLIAGAAERLREMTEAAIREEDALDARARERTSHYLALVAEERAALEGDARQALARLAEASQAARVNAAEAGAETAATLEAAAHAADALVRRHADEMGEAAFAASQHADQAFEARIGAARKTIDAAAGLVEEAGARAAARIEQGLEGARSSLDQISALLTELEGRLDQAPQVAQARAEALRAAVEAGSAELAAAAKLAAEETQAIDAAFQARAKANYAALGEAARRMGAMSQPAPAAALQPHLTARPALSTPAAAPAPAPGPAMAFLNGSAAHAPAAPAEAPRAHVSADAAPSLRPRLKLTATPDADFDSLFEPAEPGPAPTAAPAPASSPASAPASVWVSAPAAPIRSDDGWSWKDLLSTLDDGPALDDEAVTDRLIGEIEALGVDAHALLPRSRTDEIAQALARGEAAGARESVRRLAPSALRRLTRRVQTDRVLRDQVERHRQRFGARVAEAARENGPAAAALLASEPGRAWLLLDAAAGEPH